MDRDSIYILPEPETCVPWSRDAGSDPPILRSNSLGMCWICKDHDLKITIQKFWAPVILSFFNRVDQKEQWFFKGMKTVTVTIYFKFTKWNSVQTLMTALILLDMELMRFFKVSMWIIFQALISTLSKLAIVCCWVLISSSLSSSIDHNGGNFCIWSMLLQIWIQIQHFIFLSFFWTDFLRGLKRVNISNSNWNSLSYYMEVG